MPKDAQVHTHTHTHAAEDIEYPCDRTDTSTRQTDGRWKDTTYGWWGVTIWMDGRVHEWIDGWMDG